jgi:hypothetical protein
MEFFNVLGCLSISSASSVPKNPVDVSATPTTIASSAGIADLVAITAANGVTFQLHELGTTAVV